MDPWEVEGMYRSEAHRDYSSNTKSWFSLHLNTPENCNLKKCLDDGEHD